ncbi:MAG: hypothetical protein Q8L79_02930 [Methylobacter sp.]|uniref:hypothetical protein n=1 Tax=Methylobacter sp. TaxID=2051955 RepID=UPI002730743C|nr:hypothetical protein [Methylobacter sp.]MDP1664054.1 hypothetical protein [Methylobacter sp.]
MNSLNHKVMLLVGVLMLFGQQTAMADNRSPSHRNAQINRVHHAPLRKPQVGHRFDSRRNVSAPAYRYYYKPSYRASYRVNQLPHRHTRVFVNPRRMFLF